MQGAGCRVQGAGCRVQVSWFMVQGSGFRVQGAGVSMEPTLRCRANSPQARQSGPDSGLDEGVGCDSLSGLDWLVLVLTRLFWS